MADGVYIISDIRKSQKVFSNTDIEVELIIPKHVSTGPKRVITNSLWNPCGMSKFSKLSLSKINSVMMTAQQWSNNPPSKKQAESVIDTIGQVIGWYIYNYNEGLYNHIFKREVPVLLYKPGYPFASDRKYYNSEGVMIQPGITPLTRYDFSIKKPARPSMVNYIYGEILAGTYIPTSKEVSSSNVGIPVFCDNFLSLGYPVQLIADFVLYVSFLSKDKIGDGEIEKLIRNLCIIYAIKEVIKDFTMEDIVSLLKQAVLGVLSYNSGLISTATLDFTF
jgi:hypothetical protein